MFKLQRTHSLYNQRLFQPSHHMRQYMRTDILNIWPLSNHKYCNKNEENGRQNAQSERRKHSNFESISKQPIDNFSIGSTYLVFKNGIIIPAAVATSNKTTCNTVNTTFISLTISARAFELSIPSTVTYCCCDKCSIFEIYEREKNNKILKLLMSPRQHQYQRHWPYSGLTIFQHFINIT